MSHHQLSLLQQMLHLGWNLTLRQLSKMAFWWPQERQIAMERWARGREEARKLNLADCVIVSFGKSGRTWFRVLISRIYQQQYQLPDSFMMNFDNLTYRTSGAAPRIFFTHDNYIGDFTGHTDSKIDFYPKKVILLVRDPRDVAVSQFHQWKYRMRPNKKLINRYPADQDLSLFDFLIHPAGLAKVIQFMNRWQQERPKIKQLLIVRYEDLKANTAEVLDQVMQFIGTPATKEQVEDAVAFASYDNMKRMEQQHTFWLSGSRLVPKDKKNPNSFKVRRAKVGGYRDDFDQQQQQQIDALVDQTLLPGYGYTSQEQQ